MNYRDKLRLEMLSSVEKMFEEDTDSLLLGALRKYFPWVDFALILNWIPEQAEDIYWVLIDLERIVVVEIPRSSERVDDAIVEVVSVNAYKVERHHAETRRRFEVAIELMKEHFSSYNLHWYKNR